MASPRRYQSLHFVHLFLPHAPFRYYPSGAQYNDGKVLDGREDEYWVDRVLANQGYQRHLLQVEMVDRMIGDLMTRLEEVGVLDEAIVVVTADHGISFQPGEPSRTINEKNAYELGMVPLFIKAPDQDRGAVDTNPARTIDVLPTVADHLGVDVPWAVDGRSLVGSQGDAPPLTVQARTGGEVALDDVNHGLGNAVSRLASLFGTEDGSLDLYSFGDYDSLIGTAANRFADRPSTLKADIDEAWRLTHVAPYTGFVPGFVHGRLTGDVETAPYLAIALNGVIRTVVETFDGVGDRASFSAILPDEAFISGFNGLKVLAVSGSEESPVIETVELEGFTRFELERASNGRVTRLTDSEDASWRVEERSPMVGYVDGASWHDSGLSGDGADLRLAGWAIDRIDKKPAERVVVFINDQFAGTAKDRSGETRYRGGLRERRRSRQWIRDETVPVSSERQPGSPRFCSFRRPGRRASDHGFCVGGNSHWVEGASTVSLIGTR